MRCCQCEADAGKVLLGACGLWRHARVTTVETQVQQRCLPGLTPVPVTVAQCQ